MSGTAALEGVLPLDKPAGPTSHDMVAVTRRALGMRRVGHTGTLDPFASGLLLLCLGRATRLAEYLSDFPKTYVARARLGETTRTDDPEGEVIARSGDWRALTAEKVAEVLASFEGEIDQRPPAYSAKKVGGRPAHRRVRAGEAVDLPPVRVTVHEIGLEELALPDVRFRVRCSTGTYVRAIARDLGERLGVGAHLTELRREAIGPFQASDALAPDELENPEAVAGALLSPLRMVEHLPRLNVDGAGARRIVSGQPLSASEYAEAGEGDLAVALDGHLLAVAVRDGGSIRPRKVFPPMELER